MTKDAKRLSSHERLLPACAGPGSDGPADLAMRELAGSRRRFGKGVATGTATGTARRMEGLGQPCT